MGAGELAHFTGVVHFDAAGATGGEEGGDGGGGGVVEGEGERLEGEG